MSSVAQALDWDSEVAGSSGGGTSGANYIRLRPLKANEADIGCTQLEQGGTIDGVLTSVTKNKFGKKEFEITTVDGTKTYIVQAGNLEYRMKDAGVKIGTAVEITYNGKTPMESGPFKGTPAHNFSVKNLD
jgi:hypothetical protein